MQAVNLEFKTLVREQTCDSEGSVQFPFSRYPWRLLHSIWEPRCGCAPLGLGSTRVLILGEMRNA